MKKWITFALALMLVLAFTGCDKHTSDAPTSPTTPTVSTSPTSPTTPTQSTPTAPTGPTTPTYQVIQAGKDQVLAAWTGNPFDNAKRIEAIGEYQANYKNIVLNAAQDTAAISFTVDFKVASCSLPFICAVTGNGAEDELKHSYYIWIEPMAEGSTITVPVNCWNTGDVMFQQIDVLSYCVNVVDAAGLSHYYYFRVDYSAFEKCRIGGSTLVGIMNDGVVLDIKDIGIVYVKTDVKLSWTAKFYVEYYPSTLKEAKGKFTDAEGKEREYTYIIENIKGIYITGYTDD